MGEAFEAIGDHWHDDAFDRRLYANYLTTYLRNKVLGAGAVPKIRSFTMALDASWGSGKTFFIQRWAQDLRRQSDTTSAHTVVSFDAWASDYAADPLVAFMSELGSELQKAVNESGLLPAAKTRATNALKRATTNVRRIALPVAGVIAKGVLKKVSAIDWAEFAQAATPHATSPSANSPHRAWKLEDVVPTTQTEAALDKLFTAQMSEHAKRKQSIEQFKQELSTVLNVLSGRDGHSAPLFIFIDELDRCKPSFAVGLLEAVKHIFGVPGVCIVIATNMDQLTHTVKAVYGEGFDARTYLHRFFDAIYALPIASGPRLIEVMLNERPIFSNQQRCKWALPRRDFLPDAYGPGPAGALTWIFQGLRLDLRSQHQVLDVMEAAALGIESGRAIHVPWLALVCGLWHSHRSMFHQVETLAKAGNNGDEVWKTLRFDGFQRVLFQPSADRGNNNRAVSLSELAGNYCSFAKQNLTQINLRRTGESRGLASIVEDDLVVDAPHSYNAAVHYSTGLIEYFALARTAGHFQVGSIQDDV